MMGLREKLCVSLVFCQKKLGAEVYLSEHFFVFGGEDEEEMSMFLSSKISDYDYAHKREAMAVDRLISTQSGEETVRLIYRLREIGQQAIRLTWELYEASYMLSHRHYNEDLYSGPPSEEIPEATFSRVVRDERLRKIIGLRVT